MAVKQKVSVDAAQSQYVGNTEAITVMSSDRLSMTGVEFKKCIEDSIDLAQNIMKNKLGTDAKKYYKALEKGESAEVREQIGILNDTFKQLQAFTKNLEKKDALKIRKEVAKIGSDMREFARAAHMDMVSVPITTMSYSQAKTLHDDDISVEKVQDNIKENAQSNTFYNEQELYERMFERQIKAFEKLHLVGSQVPNKATSVRPGREAFSSLEEEFDFKPQKDLRSSARASFKNALDSVEPSTTRKAPDVPATVYRPGEVKASELKATIQRDLDKIRNEILMDSADIVALEELNQKAKEKKDEEKKPEGQMPAPVEKGEDEKKATSVQSLVQNIQKELSSMRRELTA